MQIGIVGLGLIGGSLAKAAKERTTHTVLGFDRDKAVLQAALQSSEGSRLYLSRWAPYGGD